MKKILALAEYGFTILSLMLYTGGPLTVLTSGGVNEGEAEFYSGSDNNSLVKIVFLAIYFITFVLLTARWKKVVYMLSKDKYILILLGIALTSILWSARPEATIVRSLGITGTTLFGLYLATRYSLKEQIGLLGWMFAIVLLLSFLFAVGLPKYGIMGGIHAGAWRGIYNHKNVLGKMMVISTTIFILNSISATKNRLILYLGLSLSIILILLSRSSSAMINSIMIIALFLISHTWRWRYEVLVPTFITIITLISSIYIWLIDNSEAIFAAVGKDATLTGRTDLWNLVWDMIWKRPWLGYGYGAFWFGGESSVSSELWNAAGWIPPNSHNGLLDLWLNVGLFGVIIFALSFCKTLTKAFIWLRYSKTSEGFWPLIFIVYMIQSNLTESALMLQNDIFWVLYVAVAYSVLLPIQEPIYTKEKILIKT
ncbi:MAG: O-antigen ligase family protein [Mojavia pulchra JT2-VF2]|jgi:O-antigen ligase|uniref:O-antigen ligase family protein n=1 Tax=Mojavia pulchra JT2-VF2 TaxID=287848 RepID=A0A951UF82_9NOST|nr:O-antigen ligase family protein [Mojavia pulchra JT2-VF2]